jgi:hypothetical protein
VVSTTPWLLYPWERDLVHIVQELGMGFRTRLDLCGKSCFHKGLNPGLSSLWRVSVLCYPSHANSITCLSIMSLEWFHVFCQSWLSFQFGGHRQLFYVVTGKSHSNCVFQGNNQTRGNWSWVSRMLSGWTWRPTTMGNLRMMLGYLCLILPALTTLPIRQMWADS